MPTQVNKDKSHITIGYLASGKFDLQITRFDENTGIDEQAVSWAVLDFNELSDLCILIGNILDGDV